MSPGVSPDRGFVTGEWTVAPSRNLLLRGSDQVRLEPRVMDVLVHLADSAGQVVSKQDLMARVWDGRYVTDDVLTVTIYALRKALGDSARRPRYIETVSRRGYRWIAPVDSIVRASMAAPIGIASPSGNGETTDAASGERNWTLPADAAPVSPVAERPRRPAFVAVAAMVALALFVAGAVWMLTAARRGRHVPSAEAHAAALKGRYFLDQRSIQGWQKALEQFERAVALDPYGPAAHAGLADTYTAMSDFGVASPAEMRPRAMRAAQRALALDPRSVEGQAALGRAQFLFDWDFAAAASSLARAVALDADYMPAHQAIAWLESARGRHAEAVAAARRALQLDPVNTARYTELAWVLALGGRHGEALREIDRALELSPRSFETWLAKGWTSELAGQPDAAFAAYRDALRIAGAPEATLQRIDAVYRAEGLAGYYRRWLNLRGGPSSTASGSTASGSTASGSTPMSDTWRAQLYVRAGDPERAIESLERAYRKREGALAWVNVEPSFQPLRSDARFQQIAAVVGRH